MFVLVEPICLCLETTPTMFMYIQDIYPYVKKLRTMLLV